MYNRAPRARTSCECRRNCAPQRTTNETMQSCVQAELNTIHSRPRLLALLPLVPLLSLLSLLSPTTTASAQTAVPVVTLEDAKRLLPASESCGSVECSIEHAYQADPKASRLALELWKTSGDVAGVGPEEVMDGGFRGTIHLVPQLPIQKYRQHLVWISSSTQAIDHFFTQLFANQPSPRYRYRALQFRFVRSLNKRRPSAYAIGWAIEYNVEGSLNISEKGVRETLFHELFHVNDDDHGDWSATHLRADYRSILQKCGAQPSVKCLAPYAPNDTMVRGGTFYAFQQNNGDTVHEYAAELAVRYFKEQSEMLTAGKLSRRAFKCGPAQNGRAWNALVTEFFGGRDLVPHC